MKPGTLEIKHGKKYAKIIIKQNPTDKHGSAWAFINKETGDILKPANWSTPAKHSRGNILTDKNFGIDRVSAYGPAYLK
ncbi:MAG: hypothetical protein JEZ11_24585 [Desulfobacterales bacterium]|nr:hypothetical protein [Desulfobacterales bacterium]